MQNLRNRQHDAHHINLMSFKFFLLQSAALVLLSWIAGHYFALPQRDELYEIQKKSANELEKINRRLAYLEQTVSRITTALPSEYPSHRPEKKENSGSDEEFAKLLQRIEAVEAQEKALRQFTDFLKKKQDWLTQMQKRLQSEPERLKNWMAALDPKKKAEVQAVYREQLDQMQKVIPVEPDAPPPNPEEMLNLLRESREKLKLKLKYLLEEAEYQAFVDSLDEGDIPSGLPLLE